MRIGIITFFQSQNNYGQILQCYALQKALCRLGHVPFLIRYGFHKQYFHWLKRKNFFTKQGRKNTLHQIIEIIRPHRERHNRRFDLFKKKHLAQSINCYNSLAELQKKPPKADCYIAGSDQIWAQLLSNDNNRSFFLDFGSKDIRRVSYAACFALEDYPENLKDSLEKHLRSFNAISVRENSGIRICDSIGINACLVVDPTLLLSSLDYKRLMKPITSSKYCYIYHVNVTTKEEMYWDAFKRYNQDSGYYSIASFANPIEGANMEFLDNVLYLYPSIEEWLGYIYHSEYVLTSSYHGVVFSILFHKPFAVCLRKESLFAGNDRIKTLLRMVQLQDRVIDSSISVNDLMSRRIDWDNVDRLLNASRQKSIAFLKNSLSL